MRPDGRRIDELRPLKIERGVIPHAEGSAMVTFGRTRVLCTASVDGKAPGWMRGQGRGWVTAEYAMLPRATTERTPRSSQTGGRSQEIQRLIGRSLRAVTDLTVFGERTIVLDCDVIEADGGTRTAAINGALIALHDAFVTLSNEHQLKGPPLRDSVAAISVGLVQGTPCLDLCYTEDSGAAVDMNVVMTGSGEFVELQGTGETTSFSEAQLRELLRLARRGIKRVLAHQRRLVGDSGLLPMPAAPASK
ncbi:MAG: ribonuclease PH [Candidatus Eisenbacteria bacterium]|uniref:Ribonuclease PH n=1 Tax=Eiseniibacteriota bacterium TaxID=2212470 RepID=A0A849SPK3_UNCEI|nr:ribonuclease PH [Candidatus Eisenbacteria bacterium]